MKAFLSIIVLAVFFATHPCLAGGDNDGGGHDGGGLELWESSISRDF